MIFKSCPFFFPAEYSLSQKRIGPYLGGDGGIGAVPGVNDSLRGEGKQLGLDAPHQCVVIAVNKVVAPDAVIKKCIPGKDTPLAANADTAGGMPWCVHNGEMKPADIDTITVL